MYASNDIAPASPRGSRLACVDNLKALVIVSVVPTHTAVIYSGLGSWSHKEDGSYGTTSLLFFGLHQSFAQAFSVGLLFLLAGRFVPGSLARKGPKRFVKDRLFRLGVPVLVFVFTLAYVLVRGFFGPPWAAGAAVPSRMTGHALPITAIIAAAFALWEAFFCAGVIIGPAGAFRERFGEGRPAARFLSEKAFGVCVFHAPILIAVMRALGGVPLYPLPKFAAASVIGVAASFAAARLIRRPAFLRKVFT